MRLKHKIAMGAALLAAVPVLVASLILGDIASEKSHDALETAARDHLTALRDLQKGEIEDYFRTIRSQVLNLSRSPDVVDALKAFPTAADSYAAALRRGDTTPLRTGLRGYYAGDYTREFRARNPGEDPQAVTILDGLDPVTVALQHGYIAANPNPLGENDRLTDPGDGTDYARLHAAYHPFFRDFQQRFGYYDLFLVDATTGRIVYTVFKELDFATSLKHGPYADTGIGEVFRKAAAATSPDFVALSDFAPYLPSYQDPAAFIAAPVFDGKQKIGVLIFQMPIDRINAVMTHNGHWRQVGLGDTGTTYLVGQDQRMRSISRFLEEDKAGYLQALRSAGEAPQAIELIDAKGTSIGLQPVDTQGSRAALAGQSGFAVFPDWRKVPVLSAYAPLAIDGQHWAILAEMDAAEAFAASHALSRQLFTITGGVAALLIAVAAGIGIWFANVQTRPLLVLSGTIREIEHSADLTCTAQVASDDELGQAAAAFNAMIAGFRSGLQQVGEATTRLAATAQKTSVVTEQTSRAVQSQLAETGQAATAITEMSATVHEVAKSVAATAQAAGETNDKVLEGQDAMEKTIGLIHQLAAEAENATTVIGRLEHHSEAIGAVVDVIRSVAEQTNLLALNAAIEAARAGEQGRGFAVVAGEIRTLAGRTQESTEEINQMVDKLQAGSKQAVSAMRQSGDKVRCAVTQAARTGDALSAITEAVGRINDMSAQIASAAEEQSAVADEINRNVVQINDMAGQTAAGARDTAEAMIDLTRTASGLQELVGRFRV